MNLTDLEASVLDRVRQRKNPWEGRRGGVSRRTISAALGRLHRKGAADCAYTTEGREWVVTPGGSAYLDRFHTNRSV